MGRNNSFLEKQRVTNQAYFDIGIQMGRQQIIDMMCVVLNDPEIMGKDTFGKERLLKVVKGIGDYIDVFQKAWERDDETDYYRDKLDGWLARIYGEELHDSFAKRYEYCSDYDYKKGRWKK